ncbi:hypothetical protein [Embleya scabrispora]|uniref:hypothetical protein n=1 Tax=Embleya scabrispora TaxID=159449 RepID=UPI001FE00C32|nr:hypothetical protein [Embleya scabrispora]
MTSRVGPEGPRISSDSGELIVRQETDGDHGDVHEVHARAFGNGERVPGLVAALRVAKAALAPMSFVATLDDRVVGHVLPSAGRLDAPRRIVDVLSLFGSWTASACAAQTYGRPAAKSDGPPAAASPTSGRT